MLLTYITRKPESNILAAGKREIAISLPMSTERQAQPKTQHILNRNFSSLWPMFSQNMFLKFLLAFINCSMQSYSISLKLWLHYEILNKCYLYLNKLRSCLIKKQMQWALKICDIIVNQIILDSSSDSFVLHKLNRHQKIPRQQHWLGCH